MSTTIHIIIKSVLFSILAAAFAGWPTSLSATPLKYQVDYMLDDCDPEKVIGRGGLGDIWVANSFSVQDGGEVIVSIEASFDTTKGWPLGIHLYDDPDDDGVPDDLVLLQSVQSTFPVRGACHEFPIPPTEVSGVFFVALSYADSVGGTDYPLLLDITDDRHQTWYVETSSPGSLDPANLPSPILRQSSVPGYGGQYLIRATGVPKPVSIMGATYDKAAGEFMMEWGSTANAFYEVLKASDLGMGNWMPLNPNRVPPDGAIGSMSVFHVPVEGDAACYLVRRTTPPAVFEEDFEREPVGWVVTKGSPTHPTIWELGEVQAGPFSAHSGTQAYGTTLSGDYANNAYTTLRSPLIDLSGVPGAKLTFWYIGDFGDTFGSDFGSVEVLDSSHTRLMRDYIWGSSTWFWNQRQIALPVSAYGSQIYLQFNLIDYNDGKVGRGIYLDDIAIRASSGLVGHWRMGEAATWNGSTWLVPDQASSPANGLSTGLSESDRVDGVLFEDDDSSYALDFHGFSHIDLGSPNKLAFDDSMTVTAWVKPKFEVTPGAHAEVQPILLKYEYKLYLQLTPPPGSPRFFWLTDDGLTHYAYTLLATPTQQWYFVVGRLDSSAPSNQLSLFVNGELRDQGDGGISPTDGPVMIGRDPHRMERVFNGAIDDVRFYDYALSDEEIQALYEEGSGP